MPIDYSKYPPNWKSGIVPRILKRAGHCCEFCGVLNKAELWSVPLKIREDGKYKTKRIWVSGDSDMNRLKPIAVSASDAQIKRVKVVLTIAHLDHDELNHDVEDDRLRALCQPCHLNYDASEKMRRIMSKSKASEAAQ